MAFDALEASQPAMLANQLADTLVAPGANPTVRTLCAVLMRRLRSKAAQRAWLERAFLGALGQKGGRSLVRSDRGAPKAARASGSRRRLCSVFGGAGARRGGAPSPLALPAGAGGCCSRAVAEAADAARPVQRKHQ